MRSQRALILVGAALAALAIAFVVSRWRRPPPPPPADATRLVPGAALGPFALGMSRADAEARRAPGKQPTDPSLVGAGGVIARVRDGKVVGVSALLGPAGVSIDGAWIPSGAHSVNTARAIAGVLRSCSERRVEAEGLGGGAGSRFDCQGTAIEVDEAHDRATVVVGAY